MTGAQVTMSTAQPTLILSELQKVRFIVLFRIMYTVNTAVQLCRNNRSFLSRPLLLFETEYIIILVGYQCGSDMCMRVITCVVLCYDVITCRNNYKTECILYTFVNGIYIGICYCCDVWYGVCVAAIVFLISKINYKPRALLKSC
jgi:hypothetical protein